MNKYVWFLLAMAMVACNDPKDSRVSSIDRFLENEAEHYQFNGNVLVAENGKVLYRESFGWADYSSKRLLNDSSIFELASISKQFTAMAVLLLEKEGKLTLQDSLRAFFPELPYANITLQHMLVHTSGLPDYEQLFAEHWKTDRIAFNPDMISLLASEKPPVRFKPGTRWEYSNTAYALLASIVEKVSGTPFADFLRDRIFVPLEMQHTRIYNTRRSGEKIENYAFGHVWSDSLSSFVLPDSLPSYHFVYNLDGIFGDGVVNSTTDDLLRWDRAFVAGTLLGMERTTAMTKPHALVDTVADDSYGYGLFVGANEMGPFVTHSGGWPGYRTNLARYKEGDRTIIVLSNNESMSTAITTTLAHILRGDSIDWPRKHQKVQLDTMLLDRFTGRFQDGGTNFEIVRRGTDLLQVFRQWNFERPLQPASDTLLFLTDPRSDIQFEVIGEGSQKRAVIIHYGTRRELKILG